jgi:Carboxypeptidase regulatory-like domain
MRTKSMRVVALAVFLLAAASASAETCDCARREAPCGAYWTAPAIFVRRVDAIQRSAGGRSVIFTVVERYRGLSSSNVTITVGPAGQRCSLAFKVGREYLVYASRSDTGNWTTSACSRTRAVEDAASDLAYARAVKDGSAPAGQISGQVLASGAPVANVLVTATSERDFLSQTATTNQAGDFTIPSGGSGRYRVAVTPPVGYVADEAPTLVDLPDTRSCAAVERRLYYNGIVEGRVVNATGRPLAGLTIELATAPSSVIARTVTDDRGWYQFVRVAPGWFVIGINLTTRRSGTPRPPRIFYPGVEKPTAARRVTLGPGVHRTLDDFALPLHAGYVAIVGVVFDPDGRPAQGARIYLKGAGDDDGILSEPAVSDLSGKFAIAALAGGSYRLFAERSRAEGTVNRVDSTDPAAIAVHEGLSPVRLTLRRRY